MTAQMEQFCKRNNLSRADETMTWEVQCPHPIPDGIFEESPDNLAVTILRHFCRELRINGNTVSIMVAC